MSDTGPRWRPAYVGIGSNLDSPREQVLSGIAALRKIPDTRLVSRSSLYESEPMGPQDQPRFINAAAALLTLLGAEDLLGELRKIEDRHGRRRDGERWGPRTLDLDLLVHGSLVCERDTLTLPHPGIAARIFVLLPLSEIAPHMVVPGLSTVAALLAQLPGDGAAIEKLDP